jgi:hypothetical protein
MTANRDLKRRVRDRQAQTGESYMTALHHVLAQRPSSIASAIPTVEFVDVTAVAAALGLKCRIAISPALAHAIDVERTLWRFRETLTASWWDPALRVMRTIALQGEHVQVSLIPAPAFQEVHRALQFVDRVLAGLGSVSEDGRMLAVRAVPRPAASGAPPASAPTQPAVPDEPIALFSPWQVPAVLAAARPPLLVVNALDELAPDPIRERFRNETP